MSFIGAMIAEGLTAAMVAGGLGTAATAAGAAGAGAAGAGLLGAGATSALAGALGYGAAGAGLGALGSAAMGQDPGQGALTGGITGGLLGGLGGLGSALNAGEATAEAANLGAGGTQLSGQTLTGAVGTPAEGVTAISSPVASTNPVSNMFNSMSSDVTRFAATNPAQQSAVIPQTGIFGNGGALSGVGDLAQGYSNMGTLGKGATALGVGMGVNAMLPNDTTSTLPSSPSMAKIDPNKYRYTQPQWSVYQPTYMADGGLTEMNPQGGGIQNLTQSGMFPQSQQELTQYATPTQMPASAQIINADYDAPTNPYSGDIQNLAQGGIADLGSYAAGGRPNLLHGPGDGVSDDIPASIAGKQPARLAQGEYVIPSRIVSELGNGSTDAGAARLDAMVQKVNAGRAKTLGGKKYAKDTKAYKHLPV